MKHLIIGSGVAGTSAAQAIRKTAPGDEITVVTNEPYPFYSRIRLIDYLAGDLRPEDIILKKNEWYRENRITLRSGAAVAKIDPALKTATLSTGESLPYDRLLLATGGSPFIPPIPGADKKGVMSLRTLEDADRIVSVGRNTKRAVVIGGGLLGLEAGFNLIKLGCEVGVVEFFPRLLPRQTDPAGAALLRRQMEGMGFRFYLGAKSKELFGGESVEGLLLEDGARLECGLALVSAGVRARADLARGLGLPVDKGVVVNDRMETSLEGVYAAGDAAEHRKVYYGIWPAAEKQGEVAGTNMAGGTAVYEGTTMSNTLKVAGISLFSAGDIDADGKQDSIVRSEVSAYRKLVISDNRIVGAILLGDAAGRPKILNAISSKKDIGPIRAELSVWDLRNL